MLPWMQYIASTTVAKLGCSSAAVLEAERRAEATVGLQQS